MIDPIKSRVAFAVAVVIAASIALAFAFAYLGNMGIAEAIFPPTTEETPTDTLNV
jgi:hypothetical protein